MIEFIEVGTNGFSVFAVSVFPEVFVVTGHVAAALVLIKEAGFTKEDALAEATRAVRATR